jgi:hypothetical protein
MVRHCCPFVLLWLSDQVVVAVPTVSSSWPTTGPVSGATKVTVTGTGFVDSPLLACRFGAGASSMAEWISATRLVCASTAQAVGSVSLEISNNNQDFTANTVPFVFQAVSTVTALSNTLGPYRTLTAILVYLDTVIL